MHTKRGGENLKEDKKKHICTVSCPECNATLEIIKVTKILEPAVKAEKEETFSAVKAAQTQLP